MAESRRRYVWSSTWCDHLTANVVAEIAGNTLVGWGRRKRWLQGYEVTVSGRTVTIKVTVRGNDQWKVHRRQMAVIVAISAAARVPRGTFGIPVPMRLSPHGNRGARRVGSAHSISQQVHGHEGSH